MSSVATEGLLQPLGDDVGSTLASSTSGRSRSPEPSARLRSSTLRAVAPRQPAARRSRRSRCRGTARGRPPAHRPEVVDLGAVGGVVVDHDQHGARAGRASRARAAPSAAPPSPSGGDGQPVGPRDRRADRVAEASPTHWKAWGNTKPCGVGHAQVHRRLAHEVRRSRRRRSARAGSIASSAMRARAGRAVAATSSYGSSRQRPPAISAASAARVRRVARRAARRAPRAAPRRSRAASPTTPRSTGRCAPIASSSRSTWITVRPRDQRAVAGRPHVQRGAERDHDVGLADQPRRRGRGEAARDADRERVAGEQSVGDRRGGEHGAGDLAEAPQRRSRRRPARRRGRR